MKDPLLEQWEQIKRSDTAIREDSVAALKALPLDELAHLAFHALEKLQKQEDGGYAYLLAMAEDHLESGGDVQCFWCIAQADGGDNAGGFNKWSKTMGGDPHVETNDVRGDVLLFERWSDARAALDCYDPEIRPNFRIYPVVAAAGNEPRTTRPPGGYQ